MKKNILLIEPFFSGSHANWAKQYKENSMHTIELLTLKGQFWKWRMYGGAVTLAKMFLASDFQPDIILASDMLDLNTFLSLVRKKLSHHVRIKVYFHENQLTYPWQEESEDKKQKRDIHYGFTNYTSALAADHLLFNSHYNMHSFYQALTDILKKMPDYKLTDTVSILKQKSDVLPIGMDYQAFSKVLPSVYNSSVPLILWNHRWEFDKNPEEFFNALLQLKQEGYAFHLALLGESYKQTPKIFSHAMESLKDHIVVKGFVDKPTYCSWLQAADILPVTSYHDFFGISVMEAVYCGCYPLLPKRLTYPDLYQIDKHPELFYDDYESLLKKLRTTLLNIDAIRKRSYRHLATSYDWKHLVSTYDLMIGSTLFVS